MSTANKQLVDLYRTMVRIRSFEERTSKEFAAGNIPGFVHSYIGQEAIAAGACANLKREDYITSTHRGHGHLIAKGAKTNLMMAELYGKKTGYCKGKGGSMHIADMDIGILGAMGIVGAGITLAAGAALGVKTQGTDKVVVCFFGDGASNTASFHEGVNLAACLTLPVVFVVENNQWAQSTPFWYSCRIANIADKSSGYGITGVSVDGNDVLAVYEAVGEAVARARKGGGSTIVECKTYRLRGHFEGDPEGYKPNGETQKWMEKDPIVRFRKKLIDMNVLTEQDADEIALQAKEELDMAVRYAEESPAPNPQETLEDVYA